MVSAKTIFAYLAYAAMTTVLFLYLLFPEETVKAYVDARLTAVDPALTIDAAVIRPTLSPGIKLVDVNLKRDSIQLIHIDDARMSPNLTTLFGQEKQARFKARLAEGTVNGIMSLTGGGPETQITAEADLAQIRLELLDAVRHFERFTLTGRLSGRITHAGMAGRSTSSGGTVSASPLTITLAAPFFGINELMVTQADAEFSLSGPSLRLGALTFGGPMVEGRINGTISLKQPWEKSRLNLSGNIKPQPELIARLQGSVPQGMVNPTTLGTRGLTFRVRGTLENPELSLR